MKHSLNDISYEELRNYKIEKIDFDSSKGCKFYFTKELEHYDRFVYYPFIGWCDGKVESEWVIDPMIVIKALILFNAGEYSMMYFDTKTKSYKFMDELPELFKVNYVYNPLNRKVIKKEIQDEPFEETLMRYNRTLNQFLNKEQLKYNYINHIEYRTLCIELPGVFKHQIKITVKNNKLYIDSIENQKYFHTGLPISIHFEEILDDNIDVNRITSDFTNGVLLVTMPFKKEIIKEIVIN